MTLKILSFLTKFLFFPLIVIVFTYLLFQNFKFNNSNILIWVLISIIFFLIIYYLNSSSKYLGFGDVKFFIIMGLFLGVISALFFNPFLIFILGLFIGSFLNSIIYRLENNLPFPLTYSFCPYCHHRLHSLDLIPVLSFLMLKGKCRYCGKKISFQYPIVEMLTGFIFFFIFKFVSMNQLSVFDLIYYLTVSSFLIIIFVYDFKNFIIPDKYLFPLILTVFAYLLFQYFKFNNLNILLNSLIGALISLIFFLIIYLISSGKYLGFGDVKFSFFMGLFLGYP
ncbi:MAG: prepilin peptidase, partial [Candidatus Pacebacteria bacterium]|nr:prepilin peptidase [Candidatus Paceibacterota bacterium]